MRSHHCVYVAVLLGATGCASTASVPVTRTFTPAAAADHQREGMVPIAVVKGAERIALPPGARVEGDTIAMPRMHVHKLAANDVIEQDEEGRIVAVSSGGDRPVVTRFVPGTATSPPTADFVRGELAGDSAGIALGEGDWVEMRGTEAAADGAVAGESHVETTRATGALVGGLVLLGLSYGPSAYVGLQASTSYDRQLVIPVAGPWLDLAQRPSCQEPDLPIKPPVDPCSFETAARALLILSGATQGVGTILTVAGLPTHSEIVKDAPGANPGAARSASPHVALVPTPGGVSLSVFGAM